MGGFYDKAYVEMPLCDCQQLSDFCVMLLQHEVFFYSKQFFLESLGIPLLMFTCLSSELAH